MAPDPGWGRRGAAQSASTTPSGSTALTRRTGFRSAQPPANFCDASSVEEQFQPILVAAARSLASDHLRMSRPFRAQRTSQGMLDSAPASREPPESWREVCGTSDSGPLRSRCPRSPPKKLEHDLAETLGCHPSLTEEGRTRAASQQSQDQVFGADVLMAQAPGAGSGTRTIWSSCVRPPGPGKAISNARPRATMKPGTGWNDLSARRQRLDRPLAVDVGPVIRAAWRRNRPGPVTSS